MIYESVLGAASSVALALASWAVKEVLKVPRIESDISDIKDDLKYIRGRVDAVSDHLIRNPPR